MTPLTATTNRADSAVTSKASPNCGAIAGAPPNSRRSDEWYTPDQYLAAVRTILGSIDLDPFSCDIANLRVKAQRYWTEQTNAFLQPNWRAESVFMNPPYSGGLVARAVVRFVEEYDAGAFPVGVVLCNNCTETLWFQRGLRAATAICFPAKRIAFYNEDNKHVSGNPGPGVPPLRRRCRRRVRRRVQPVRRNLRAQAARAVALTRKQEKTTRSPPCGQPKRHCACPARLCPSTRTEGVAPGGPPLLLARRAPAGFRIRRSPGCSGLVAPTADTVRPRPSAATTRTPGTA